MSFKVIGSNKCKLKAYAAALKSLNVLPYQYINLSETYEIVSIL